MGRKKRERGVMRNCLIASKYKFLRHVIDLIIRIVFSEPGHGLIFTQKVQGLINLTRSQSL